jgi:hypothetical protein
MQYLTLPPPALVVLQHAEHVRRAEGELGGVLRLVGVGHPNEADVIYRVVLGGGGSAICKLRRRRHGKSCPCGGCRRRLAPSRLLFRYTEH